MRPPRWLAQPWPRLIVPTLVLFTVGFALVLNSALAGHPQLTRQAAIDAAVSPSDRHLYSRVAAKLMHRSDLERADREVGSNGQPNQLVWVVAISGNYGIGPSFGCCSVPADYHGKNTWGVAIIADAPGRPVPGEFVGSWHGDWPPFFDGLPDLSAGR